jgi:hypothetical protein
MFFFCRQYIQKQKKVCSESYHEQYVGFYSHNQVPYMGFDACEVGFYSHNNQVPNMGFDACEVGFYSLD